MRETEIHYSPYHLNNIRRAEGVKEVVKRWSKIVGKKMTGLEDANGLTVKRK